MKQALKSGPKTNQTKSIALQPPKLLGDEQSPLRILLFAAFLASNVVFMHYRASLTSELVTRAPAMPFITLEDLYFSDFQ